MQQTELKVDGMTCGGCANGVSKALKALPGVVDVTVDLAGKKVAISHESVEESHLRAAIEAAGFDVL